MEMAHRSNENVLGGGVNLAMSDQNSAEYRLKAYENPMIVSEGRRQEPFDTFGDKCQTSFDSKQESRQDT